MNKKTLSSSAFVFILLILFVLSCTPTNQFNGKKMQSTYVPQWSQAMGKNPFIHASVPLSNTDCNLIGRAMCEINGIVSQVTEFSVRDPDSNSVEFEARSDAVEIYNRLKRIFDESNAIQDIVLEIKRKQKS